MSRRERAEAGSAQALVRRHAPFLVLLLLGAVLRAAVLVAFRPALMFYGDSYGYLADAKALRPGTFHPLGYPLFLRTVTWTGTLLAVPVVQHALGLLVGVGVYVLGRRLGLGRWTGALAAGPALLDAWVVDLEQFVLSETVFILLVLLAVGLLLWRPRPSTAGCAAAGTLLALAACTRLVGVVVLAPVLVVALLSRWGWQRPVALGLAAAAVLVGYASWYGQVYGQFGFTAAGPHLLYGRVAVFADCSQFQVPAHEQALCPPPGQPRLAAEAYTWSPQSPYRRYVRQPGPVVSAEVSQFNRRALLAQPGAWTASTLRDVAGYLDPRVGDRLGRRLVSWQLLPERRSAAGNVRTAPGSFAEVGPVLPAPPAPAVVSAHRPAHLLQDYQRVEHLPGPLVVLGVLGVLAGLLRLRGPGSGHRRRALVLPAAAGVVLLLATAASSAFDYRYLLPVLLLVWPAGVLGVVTAVQARRLHGPDASPGVRDTSPGMTALPHQPALSG